MEGIKNMGKHIKYADINKRAKFSISKSANKELERMSYTLSI